MTPQKFLKLQCEAVCFGIIQNNGIQYFRSGYLRQSQISIFLGTSQVFLVQYSLEQFNKFRPVLFNKVRLRTWVPHFRLYFTYIFSAESRRKWAKNFHAKSV